MKDALSLFIKKVSIGFLTLLVLVGNILFIGSVSYFLFHYWAWTLTITLSMALSWKVGDLVLNDIESKP